MCQTSPRNKLLFKSLARLIAASKKRRGWSRGTAPRVAAPTRRHNAESRPRINYGQTCTAGPSRIPNLRLYKHITHNQHRILLPGGGCVGQGGRV